MSDPIVLSSADLREFFQNMISDALTNQRVEVSPHATTYITDLLVTFQETAHLFAQKNVRLPVLVDMLTEAMEADLNRRILILKQLGDTSLMVSGFFPEALSRSCLDISYYQKMGEIAYSHVGSLSEAPGVFEELSERFIRLANVLHEVSERTMEKDYSVLKLLEFYSNTGSERVLDLLKRQNIHPLPRKKDDGIIY